MMDNIRFLITANPRGQYASWFQVTLSEVMDMDLEMYRWMLEAQVDAVTQVDNYLASRSNS